MEPTQGIPNSFLIEGLEEEDARSSVTDDVDYGEIRVQKRLIKEGK